MLIRLACLTVCLGAAMPAPGFAAENVQPPDNIARRIAVWEDLNSACRDGSPDQDETFRACDARDALGPTINDAGWCFGIEDQPENEFLWAECDLITNYFPRPGAPPVGETAPIDPPDSDEYGETPD